MFIGIRIIRLIRQVLQIARSLLFGKSPLIKNTAVSSRLTLRHIKIFSVAITEKSLDTYDKSVLCLPFSISVSRQDCEVDTVIYAVFRSAKAMTFVAARVTAVSVNINTKSPLELR